MPDAITAETLATSLREQCGMRVAPEQIRLEWRYWRWVAFLPNHRIAYIADRPEAADRLGKERAVLERLAHRVSFDVPAVAAVSADERIQIRAMVPGMQVVGGREPLFGRSRKGARLAADLGHALAELHEGLSLEECKDLSIGRCGTIHEPAEFEATVTKWLPERATSAAFRTVLARLQALEVPKGDLVFVHGDVYGGNLSVDPETGKLNGLFDFDEMGVGDRNLDLQFLYSFGENFEDRALDRYAHRSKGTPTLRRIRLYHLVSAFEALASAMRSGDGPKITNRERWVDASIDKMIDGLD